MTRKQVVSIRLTEAQVEDLHRTARRLGQAPAQTAAMLVDEGLRRERFPQIEMRDTVLGREGFLKGHRLSVSFVVEMIEAGETPEEFAEARCVPRHPGTRGPRVRRRVPRGDRGCSAVGT